MDWSAFLREFGFPLTAVALLIFGSATGVIIWRGAHKEVVAARDLVIEVLRGELVVARAGWKSQTDANLEMASGLKVSNELMTRLVNEKKRGG